MPREVYEMTNTRDWTKLDEFKQRIGNCKRFLVFAWLSLITDSATFAIVFVNSVAANRSELIATVMRDGRRIDPDNIG